MFCPSNPLARLIVNLKYKCSWQLWNEIGITRLQNKDNFKSLYASFYLCMWQTTFSNHLLYHVFEWLYINEVAVSNLFVRKGTLNLNNKTPVVLYIKVNLPGRIWVWYTTDWDHTSWLQSSRYSRLERNRLEIKTKNVQLVPSLFTHQ